MFFFVFIVVVVCFAVFLCSIYRSSFRHRSFLSTYFVSTCVNRRKRQTEQTEEWGWGENEKFILLMPAISVMEFENSIVSERMKQHWHVSVMMMRAIVSRMLTAFYDHQHTQGIHTSTYTRYRGWRLQSTHVEVSFMKSHGINTIMKWGKRSHQRQPERHSNRIQAGN